MDEKWKNPGAEYRSIPFLSMNGELEKEELISQLEVFRQMGTGGAFLHPRTGLSTEYMSEEWLDFVEVCVDALAKNGMGAWLYDEDRWPSGTCGGLVTQNPRFRLKFLSMHILEPADFSMKNYGQEFVGAFAVEILHLPEQGGVAEMKGFRKIWNALEVPEGWKVCVFCVEEMAQSEFYNGYTYLDTMNREAFDEYLRLTHEKYRKRFGERFGKDILGMFTDEPHRGALLNGFGISNPNAMAMLPYTYTLFDTFFARWGKRLEDELPRLWFRENGEIFSETVWQFVEVLEELFLENYAKPYGEWCRANRIAMTGHILHEDTLSCQTTMSGSMMRFYEHMDIPGMDNLTEVATLYFVPKMVQSVAKQCGKKWTLSELFGGTGWKSTFETYKQIGDWQTCFGINVRCPHLSWYTMKGESKRDYPASIHKQSAWYPQFRALEDYFARLGYLLTENESVTETLVVMPVESAWGLSYYGTYVDYFSLTDPAYIQLEENFRKTADALVDAHIDFDYGDEEMMSRLAAVETEEEGVVLRVGKMRYRTLILSGMLTLRKSTLRLANEFAAAGGKVILCGSPSYLEGKRQEIPFHSAVFRAELDSLAAAVPKGSALRYRVENGTGRSISALRRSGEDWLLFVANTDRKEGFEGNIVLEGEWNVERLDLRRGETAGIFALRSNGKTTIPFHFALSEELMLRITRGEVQALPAEEPERPAVEIPREVGFSLSEDNVLVLDWAACRVDGEFLCENEILKVDRAVRGKFGLAFRGGEMVQPWFRKKFFGEDFVREICDLELTFRFNAEEIPQQISLMTEEPDSCRYLLNGEPLKVLSVRKSHIDCCFRIFDFDANQMKKGENFLTVSCKFREEINLEALYLLGKFGVRAGRVNTITAFPETLRFGDITEQGLPFYSGNLTYRIPVREGKYRVNFGKFSAACLSSGEEIAAFAPFVLRNAAAEEGELALTAHLTRKNLFGPLHEVPAELPVCGPGDFLTEGEQFSRDYMLIQQGILEPPEIFEID